MTMSIPLCHFCKHYQGENRCTAFDEIPNAIIYNEHDHRKPYPGDNGITFTPIDDATKAAQEVFR